ncbi:hypothetical protein CMI37_28050 [Candidatus Pacearchaeota archaeon]|jgi:hypothetical protein|nr:hypothetical protein [Candidatus Pacearchaeota archaeon]|tara:strand:+ start:407 stop:676 length:270 start_codon:yes stop_codon:yes gene_type:complete
MTCQVETLSVADVLDSTEAMLPVDVDLYLHLHSAAVKLRRLVRVEGLTRADVDQRFNPDDCLATAVVITEMLTPWTPDRPFHNLNLWRA